MNPLDLSQFVRMTKFSWTGVQSEQDFETLRTCLRVNALHLKTLKLDLIDWEQADELWSMDHSRFVGDGKRSKNFFATDIIGPEQNKPGLSFPSLESLSLSEVSFETAINELHSAFAFSALRTLKLWNCRGLWDLLAHAADSQQVIRLTSLEIVMGSHNRSMWENEQTSKFLRAFSGLKDLYLSLPMLEWTPIPESMMGHMSTLKRMVLHGRTIDIDFESDHFQEETDLGVEWSDELESLFIRTNCDVVGITNLPDFMVSTLIKS